MNANRYHAKAFEGANGFFWLKAIARASVISLAGAILFFAIALTYYYQEEASARDSLLSQAGLHVAVQKKVINRELKDLSYSLHFLSHQSGGQHALSSSEGRLKMVSQFHSIMASVDNIDQLRILDLKGMETVRVNYNSGQPKTVPENLLQDKSNRYYYSELQKLNPHEYYLSSLDLNIEHGKVEVPYKPMIRIGMAVYEGKTKVGYIVLNYLAKGMLDRFREASRLIPLDTLLIDSAGTIISSPNSKLDWNHKIEDVHEFSLVRKGVSDWASIKETDEAVLEEGDRAYVSLNIHPYLEIPTSPNRVIKSGFDDYFLKLLVIVKDHHVSQSMQAYRDTAKLWYIIVVLMLLSVSIPLGILLERRKSYINQIKLLEQAVKQAGESLVITDPKSRIEYVNPKFSVLTGYQEEDAIGRTIAELLKSSAQDTESYKELWSNISSGKEWSGYLIDRKKDGSVFPAHVSISPIFDRNHNITHYMAIVRDATEHQLLHDKTTQEEKMKVLGIAIGGVAHEFNNILAALMGNTFLLKQIAKQNPEAISKLNTIDALGNKAAGMIRQMLAYVGHAETALTNQPVSQFFNRAIDYAFKIKGECSAQIENNISDFPIFIEADLMQLQKVVDQLISNACDAVSGVDEGKISISLKEVDRVVESRRNHRYLRFSVQDNGMGIKREHMSLVFEPFFTTKEPGKGTGLGLSSAFGIVKKHNGIIDVESEIGVGTTFSVFLPIVKEE